MKLLVSADAGEYLRSHGGRLYVWTDAHRCCSGPMTFLKTSPQPPHEGGTFTRVPGAGFELYFDPGRLDPPDELHVELEGWRKKRVKAYWNGCAFAL